MNKSLRLFVLCAAGGIVLSASLVSAATTIGSNIQTDGSLSVTGTSNLGVASTTLLSASGPAYFGSSATSTFDTAGNLIIGTTTSALSALTIIGDVNNNRGIEVHNNYAAGISLYTHALGNQTFRAPIYAFYKSRGSQSAPTAVQNRDLLGYLQWYGYDGTAYTEGSVIESVAAENWASGSSGTDLNFYTNSTGSNSLHLDMSIRANDQIQVGGGNETTSLGSSFNINGDASIGNTAFVAAAAPTNGLIVQGNTGVGTSTPIANFQVANGSNATTTMELGSSGQNKGSCLKMYRTDGSAIYAYVAAGATTFTLTTTACASVSNF